MEALNINEVLEQHGWEEFIPGYWQQSVNLRDFIQKNYTPYDGDSLFLSAATERTRHLWAQVLELIKQEHAKSGPLDFDNKTPSTIVSHAPGYIDKALEKIVGLQTDAPLKRAIMPYGGIRMVESSAQIYGKSIRPEIHETFTQYRKTHNQGVFDAYDADIRKCRKAGIITGLPDSYGRGRIIGDSRRIALYGVDFLIRDKQWEKEELLTEHVDEDNIRLREELAEQIRALQDIKQMARNVWL